MVNDHTRMIVKAARLYFESNLRQQEIAEAMAISQSKVSRLLKEAAERGIVRSVVVVPDGVHAELEEELERALGITQAIVVDSNAASPINVTLGHALANYIESTATAGEVIGVSTWSSALIAAVRSLRAESKYRADRVVQMFGGVGSPEVQYEATRLTSEMARLLSGEAVYVPAPAVVGSAKIAKALRDDPDVQSVQEQWGDITVSFVGIGALQPSPLLAKSGNAVTDDEMQELRDKGAVGDVCLRFFNAEGQPIKSSFDKRVVGMSPEAIRAVSRRVGVAGGAAKVDAIRAAGVGGWINVLITDRDTARALVDVARA